MSTGFRRQSGFTLMELVIVCLLAGIFLTVAVPTVRNTLLVDQLDSTARKIIGTVGELRNLAVREHTPHLLHFDLQENRLWYELDGSIDTFENDEQEKKGLELPDDVRLVRVLASSQENASGSTVTLWISRKGYMDQTFVQLSDDKGRERTLLFSPFSGSPRIYDEFVEDE